MQAATKPHGGVPAVYALPEHAHLELIQLRDHLRLMAQLTECGSNASRHDARLRPDALAWWFTRLARDVGGIVDATYWSSAIGSEKAIARKKAQHRRDT